MFNPLTYVLLATTSFLAGAINAVAGGGTLITFPALLGAGITPVVANATSTVALVPGSFTAMLGFRQDMQEIKHMIPYLMVPSVLGSLVGAKIMLWAGNAVLAHLVPWLILLASTLFLLQEPISRLAAANAKKLEDTDKAIPSSKSPASQALAADMVSMPCDLEKRTFDKNLIVIMIFQFFIAIYGGYFGAGIGILTLASLGFFGLTHIHQMNGLKNLLTATINLVATITFIAAGQINWIVALVMSVGAIAGGYCSVGMALKIGQRRVRQLIIAVGFSITIWMFWRQLHGGL